MIVCRNCGVKEQAAWACEDTVLVLPLGWVWMLYMAEGRVRPVCPKCWARWDAEHPVPAGIDTE